MRIKMRINAASNKMLVTMQNQSHSKPPRKPKKLSLSNPLLAEADALDINAPRSAEACIVAAVAVAKRKRELWLQENAEAIESSNRYMENSGLPLEKFRQF